MGSAAYRISFTYSAALAFAIVLLGTAVYVAADASFKSEQDASIAQESAALVEEYRKQGIGELRTEIALREAGHPTNSFGYALYDSSGRRIAGALNLPRPSAGWADVTFLDPDEGPDPARALASDLHGGLRLVVAADKEPIEQIDRTVLILFSGAFGLVLVLGAAGALLLGGYLRQRLEGISSTARAIVAGDLDRRVPVGPRGDEFDQLGLALNAMLDRIANLLENLRQISSDVAHDLRTPLARLRNQLAEMARQRDGADEMLARAIHQSDELLALFAAILRISEVEGGALARTFAPVALSALLLDLHDSFLPAVSDGGRVLQSAIEPGLTVRGDRELISQAVINLIDNAQRHTPPGTCILMQAMRCDNCVCLSVSDNGPGVPPRDRSRITHRFARLDVSRTTPGHGLGLNLVSAIAAAHRGALLIEDNEPGLRVTIKLPLLVA